MVDFIKFVKDHPGIDLNIEFMNGSPRGIVITMTKHIPLRRFRFCIGDDLYFNNQRNIYQDMYIETWLNNGLKELNKDGES